LRLPIDICSPYADSHAVLPARPYAALGRRDAEALLVTMGCGEACPFVPGLRRDDWALTDPKGQPLEKVREIRDEIRGRVDELVRSQGWQRPR
jgi:arsenate reductase